MVKQGEQVICIKTVIMDDTVTEAFTRGKVYLCENDDHLTDNQGDKLHGVFEYEGMSEEDKKWFKTHFVSLNDLRVYDTPFTTGKMGVKETTGKLNYELDFVFITQIAERMSKNKDKYPPYNWQKLHDIEELKQALFRHVLAVMDGTYEDDGREFGHLEAIALNAMFINYHAKKNK
jgi:hypothetical protein